MDNAFNVNLNNIFYQLHLNAESACGTTHNATSGEQIINTGVDYGNTTFYGSGDFMLQVIKAKQNECPEASNASKVNEFRSRAKDVITDYATSFFGENVQIAENDLHPMTEIRHNANANVEYVVGFAWCYTCIVDFNTVHHPSEIAKLLGVDEGLSQQARKIINKLGAGTIKIAGNTLEKFAKGAFKTAKAVLGNTLSDLLSFKIHTTYGDIGIPGTGIVKSFGTEISQWAAKHYAEFKEALSKMLEVEIDIKEAQQRIQEALNTQIVGSNATVNVMLASSVVQHLHQIGGYNDKIKQFLAGHRYCILITVDQNDDAYPEYSINRVGEIVTSALRPFYVPLFDLNKNGASAWGHMRKLFDKQDVYKNVLLVHGYNPREVPKKNGVKFKGVKKMKNAISESSSAACMLMSTLFSNFTLNERQSLHEYFATPTMTNEEMFDKIAKKLASWLRFLHNDDLRTVLNNFNSSDIADDTDVKCLALSPAALSPGSPQHVSTKDELCRYLIANVPISTKDEDISSFLKFNYWTTSTENDKQKHAISKMKKINGLFKAITHSADGSNPDNQNDSTYDAYIVVAAWLTITGDKPKKK